MIDHPCVLPGKSWECGSEILVLRGFSGSRVTIAERGPSSIDKKGELSR